MKTEKQIGRVIYNGVILDLALAPVQTDKEPWSAWRNGKVTFDGRLAGTYDCGGGWIENEGSANQKNEEAGIAGGLRQGVSYPNETAAGSYTPYGYGEDESGWQEAIMSRIFGEDWANDDDADENARNVHAAIQKGLAKLA